jgi:hypothetical protein
MDPETHSSLLDARAMYFEQAGFASDGGYNDKWVEIDMGRFSIKFPNTDARLRAVRYHDLHHVVTGYGTDLTGEAEIAAWEIASSCRGFIAAWVLNLLVFGYRLVREPQRLYRAFVRGCHSQNLYDRVFDDALLARSVREMRRELGLIAPARTGTLRDRLAFLGWGTIGVILAWGPLVAPVGFLAWWLT